MTLLAELLETGRLTPVIDRAFPLDEARAAMRYLVSGRARGRLVMVPRGARGGPTGKPPI